MPVCILLTHSQKNLATSVSLCISKQTFANEAAGYSRTVGRRYVAKHRRRSDETLLEAFFAGYICATSKSQLTRVDVYMKNGMATPKMNGTHLVRRCARTSAMAGALL